MKNYQRYFVITMSMLLGSVQTGCITLQTLREDNMRLNELVSELQQQNEQYKETFYTLLQQKQRQEAEAQKEADRLSREIERYKTQRSQTEKDLRARIRELNLNLQSEMDTMAAREQSLNQKIQTQESGLKAKDAEIAKAQTDLQAAQKEAAAAKQSMTKAQSDLKQIQAQLETLTTSMNDWESKISAEQGEVEKRDQTIASLNTKIAALDDTIKDNKSVLQQREKTIAELNERIKNMLGEFEQKQAVEASLRQNIKQLQTEMESKGTLSPEAEAEFQKQIGKLNQELNKVKDEQKQLATQNNPQLKKIETFLSEALKSAIKKETISIVRDARGVVVRIKSDDLFKPGTVMIDPSIEKPLENLARALRQFANNSISVEGYTDNQPVIEMPFPDNLALSVKRAENVTRHLIKVGELPQENIRAIGYGERKPITSNKNVEGRRKNRRVEIVIGVELPSEEK